MNLNRLLCRMLQSGNTVLQSWPVIAPLATDCKINFTNSTDKNSSNVNRYTY